MAALPKTNQVVRDLGHLSYEKALEIQRQTLEEVAAGVPDTLLLVEHDPILTLGANFHPDNLLFTPDQYKEKGIQVTTTDRGGDVTFHGPNQLVAYPIFDLNRHGRDLHKWLRGLEEATILTLKHFNLEGYRYPPHTGVWVNGKKICAIGIKVKRWVSMHGIALNCNNDLTPFNLIIPCGIKGHTVTSLTEELGREVTTEEVKPLLVKAFEAVFSLDL
jgi:lipoyl(octanoyl) transferase